MTEPTDEALLTALDAADGHLIHTMVAAWTWLEQRLHDLGSRKQKPHSIRAYARELPAFAVWDAQERRKIEQDALVGAAELVVRVHQSYERAKLPTFALPMWGFDGAQVIVVWKAPALANWTIEVDLEDRYAEGPPAMREHPSMMALTPRLVVCPRMVNQIELLVVRQRLDLEGWRTAWDQLEHGLASEAQDADTRRKHAESGQLLSVHLDALGDAGQSGWTEDPDPELYVGHFDEATIGEADEEQCCRDAERAVYAASGSPSVLVMPELVATSRIERKIVQTLDFRRNAPALTVVGLYHRDVPPAEAAADGQAADLLAPYVNEAIVLAPDGSELWRHRKLTYAQGGQRKGARPDEPGLAEDIRPGRVLQIVPTPLGMVAVIVCLDSFAERVGPRITKSGADVLLVPSLSPHVKRHHTALQQVVQSLWGIAFVANRPLADTNHAAGEGQERAPISNDSRSFWAMQRKGPCASPTCTRSPSCVIFRLGRPCAVQDPLKSDSSMLDDEGEAP